MWLFDTSYITVMLAILKTGKCHDTDFVVTVGTRGCHHDNQTTYGAVSEDTISILDFFSAVKPFHLTSVKLLTDTMGGV